MSGTRWTKPGGSSIEGENVRRYYERNDLPISVSKRVTCAICKHFLGWADEDEPVRPCTRSHDEIPLAQIQEARK